MFLAQIGFCRFTLPGTGDIDQVAVPPRVRFLLRLVLISGRCRKGNHKKNGQNKSSHEHNFIFTDCCSLPSDQAHPEPSLQPEMIAVPLCGMSADCSAYC